VEVERGRQHTVLEWTQYWSYVPNGSQFWWLLPAYCFQYGLWNSTRL